MHHFISIGLIAICSIIIDLLFGSYSYINIITIVNSFFYILTDIFLYSYYKYLIEFKYYFFLDVLFISGVMNLIINFTTISVILLYQHLNDNNSLIFQFYTFYMEFGIGIMASRFLLFIFFFGFIVFTIEFLVLNKLTPNHVIISFEIGKIPESIVFNESNKRWLVLLVAIFQIIFLLFYLEIFEYNFCSLNENTKKNIEKRMMTESIIVNEDYEEKITIGEYDISEGFNKSNETIFDTKEENI